MQLYEFDATQTNPLYPVKQDIQRMKIWLADLEGLFKEGITDSLRPESYKVIYEIEGPISSDSRDCK